MTGPSSERTADADVALLRGHLSVFPLSHPCHAALDRLAALVAQHHPPEDAEVEEIRDALRELDQLKAYPNESLGSPKAQRALVTIDRLVAQHRDTQEALERFEKALEHLRQVIELCDGCAPIDLQALADMGFPGPITAHQLANEIARRAALASVRARTPA